MPKRIKRFNVNKNESVQIEESEIVLDDKKPLSQSMLWDLQKANLGGS